jgi:outer membrane PBP1 activator LpoA protein
MPRSSTCVVLCLFLVTIAVTGCGIAPARQAPPPAAAAAEQAFAEGDFAVAAQGFLEAAADQRSRRDFFRLRAAEAWREEGDLARARSTLEGVTPKRLQGDERLRLNLLQAELALDAGNAADALARLALSPESVPNAYRARFHEIRARAAECSGDAFTAASERAMLDRLLPATERAANLRDIDRLLATLDGDTLYARSAALPAGHPLYAYAGRMLTMRGLALPRPYERGGALTSSADIRPPADADGYRPYNQIALILPLNGAIAMAANAVRDGFFTAYFAETRTKPEVRVYAVGDDTAEALATYQRAVAEGAQAVVGPLARDSVATLFEQGQIQVPLLALNRGGDLPPPPGSVSFALAPEDEGIAAAQRLRSRGWSRALIVAGGDEHGQRSAAAFRERLQRNGGNVVADVRLPDDSPDYAPLIRQALGLAGSSSVAASGDPGVEQNRQQVPVDAIFLAVRVDQARLFAPQLRVAGVYDVPIVATSQIAAGGANPRLDRELDGIEFADAPWLFADPPGLPRRETLAETLDSARGAGARLVAFGIDAFRLLGYLDHLMADPNARLPGATGELRIDGFGNVLRAPSWARFSGGHARPAPDGGLIGDDVQYRQP